MANPFNSPLIDKAVDKAVFLKAEAFAAFKKLSDSASDLSKKLQPGSSTATTPGPDISSNKLQELFANGVSPDSANELLLNDIRRNEKQVKSVLSANGVKSIPQGAFDGLVSMQNQLGNISYVYVKGEKIDMTSLYKTGDWNKVATYIAADERDRPRRIQEAAMMAKNDYGPAIDEQRIIDRGFAKASELAAKGLLNQQTGRPATDQQQVALANNYFATLGKPLPGISMPLRMAAAKNAETDELAKKYKKQAGPWPY